MNQTPDSPTNGQTAKTNELIAKLPVWLRQFVKFGLVGVSGIVVNMLITYLMNQLNGGAANAREPVWTSPINNWALRYSYLVYIVAFIVANTWNYQLNRKWTFRGTNQSWWRGFFYFFGAGVIGAIVGLAVKIALTHPNSPLYLPGWFTDSGWRAREYWGQLAGVLVGTPVNFVVNKLVTFRQHETASRDGSR